MNGNLKEKERETDPMANVYAVSEDGTREFYATASTNRELYQYTDDIEELGMTWDFDLL